MRRLLENDVIRRLATRDASLFAEDAANTKSVLDRMGWIGLAHEAVAQLAGYESIARQIIADGAEDVVLLGMGGSSLASLVFAEVYGPAEDHPRLHVLDTTSPVTVSSLIEKLNPATTHFLLSSKSGTTIEPLSLYAIFRAWADEALGRDAAGQHFVVITDPGSPLEALATSDTMRLALPAPPDVGGRFSALTAFGLMPAAILGVDLGELLRRATQMDEACRAPGEDNPGALLAAWIADAHAAGRDKLTLVASARLDAFPLWIEQLVAESTGKRGIGIVPVPETAMREPSGFGQDRAVVVLRQHDDGSAADWAAMVRAEGHPVLEIELPDALGIGAEFVRWEYATAMIGFLLGMNPFDEPDVGAAKKATMDVLGGAAIAGPDTEIEGVRISYAGGLRRAERAPADLAAALEPVFSSLSPGDYLGLLTYLPGDEPVLAPLRRAAGTVAATLCRATCFELGPRYLHSTGQLHKGGANEGVFVVVTARDDTDLAVPGQTFSLAELYRAQAEGDFMTLSARGRRVVGVDLPNSDLMTVMRVADALEAAAARL